MPGHLRNLPPLHPRRQALQIQPSRREDFPLYDTIFFAAATVVRTGAQLWFAVPLGAIGSGFAAPGKTIAETNMDNQSRLPDEVEHHVRSIQIQLQPATGDTQDDTLQADALNIMHNCALQFTQPAFLRNYGPLDQYPSGGGLYVGFAGQATGVNINNGVPAAGAAVRLREPIILGRGQTFNFVLNVVRAFTPTGAWRIRCSLPGIQARDVVQG